MRHTQRDVPLRSTVVYLADPILFNCSTVQVWMIEIGLKLRRETSGILLRCFRNARTSMGIPYIMPAKWSA
jgi:hypothetical protein